jgi:WD40 repeat protein
MTQRRVHQTILVIVLSVSIAACETSPVPPPPTAITTLPAPTLTPVPTQRVLRQAGPVLKPTLTFEQQLITSEALSRLPGRLIFSTIPSAPSGNPITMYTYLIQDGHKPQGRLVDAGYPDLSPDGQWLVYSHFDNNGQIHAWVAQINCELATNVCQLGESLDLGSHAGGFAWSPDSIHLAYTTAGNSGKVWRSEQLFMANVISRTVITVLDKGAGEPTFSPDGKWVLMQAGYLGYYQGVLAMAAVDGSHYQLISNSIRQWPARWRPDGTLEYSMFTGAEEVGPHIVMSVDGVSTTLGLYPQVPHMFLNSPDGQHTIYRQQEGSDWLHLAKADGSQARSIVSDQHWRAIAWSPDSRYVVIGHLRTGFSDGAWSKYRLIQFDRGEVMDLPAGLDFAAWIDNESYLALGQRLPEQEPEGSLPWPNWTSVYRVWLDGHVELLITITGLASSIRYWNKS